MQKVSDSVYWSVLAATILTFPFLVPFTAPIIKQKPRVVDIITTITAFTIPYSTIPTTGLYAWSMVLEVFFIPAGEKMRRAIDGE